jgi:parallel beta helix pectate lyase-like protein
MLRIVDRNGETAVMATGFCDTDSMRSRAALLLVCSLLLLVPSASRAPARDWQVASVARADVVPVTSARRDTTSGLVSVAAHGAVGDGRTDASAAFAAARAAGATVYVPPGIFVVGDLPVPSDTRLVCASPDSVILAKPGASSILVVGREDFSAPTRNVRIENCTLRGRVTSLGYSQFEPLVFLYWADRVTFQNVNFRGWRGDAVTFQGASPGGVKQNTRIVFDGCTFDGEKPHNRNGISIIDADGVRISHSVFRRLGSTTSGEPSVGAIDVEPDATDQTVRNVVIRDNVFEGSVRRSHIALSETAGALTSPFQNITIERNVFQYGSTGTAAIGYEGAVMPGLPQAIVIRNNRFECCLPPSPDPYSASLRLHKVQGVVVEGNTFLGRHDASAKAGPVLIGRGNESSTSAADVTVRDNLFDGAGGVANGEVDTVMFIGASTGITIENNDIVATITSIYGLWFEASGPFNLDRLVVRYNRFVEDRHSTFAAAMSGTGVTFSGALVHDNLQGGASLDDVSSFDGLSLVR